MLKGYIVRERLGTPELDHHNFTLGYTPGRNVSDIKQKHQLQSVNNKFSYIYPFLRITVDLCKTDKIYS